MDAQTQAQIKETLEHLHDRYNRVEFIEEDPISVPHRFSDRNDREIAGFFAATIAWGNRKSIVRNAHRMMHLMDDQPADFVRNASEEELRGVLEFAHRTFNGMDFHDFILALRFFEEQWGGIGSFFEQNYVRTKSIASCLALFRKAFFTQPHDPHCEKHISSIERGAACKRLNMYLRWMVRSDERGVDFGLWSSIPMSALYIPLDVHVGAVARELGLLVRRLNDWKAVEELSSMLRSFDPSDPVRYDFSLFGAGIDGAFK